MGDNSNLPALPVNQFQIASQLSSIYFSLALCPSVTEGRGEGGALWALDTGLETPGGHLGRTWTGLETERGCVLTSSSGRRRGGRTSSGRASHFRRVLVTDLRVANPSQRLYKILELNWCLHLFLFPQKIYLLQQKKRDSEFICTILSFLLNIIVIIQRIICKG